MIQEDGRRNLTLEDYRSGNIPRRYWDISWATVQDGPHRDILRRYVLNMERMIEEGYGFFLHGGLGVGKTSVALLLMKEAMRRGKSGYFIRSWELKHAVINHVPWGKTTSVEDRVRNIDVLAVDDFGREFSPVGPRWNEQFFEDLIRHRTSEKRPTYVTTTFPLEELERMYGVAFKRVCQEAMMFLEVQGKDLRDVRRVEQELNTTT